MCSSDLLLGQPVNTPDEMFTEGRLIATLDGITDDGRIIVEAKTTTAYSSDDPVPPAYYWQVQAQLACVPTATYGLVVVLDKRMRLGSWVVVRNDADIAGLLLRADEIGDCIDARQLPVEAEPTEEQVKMLFPAPAGVVELPASAVALIDAWQAAKAARTDAEALEQQYRDRVAALLGEAESGTLDGRTLVTFKARKGSSRLDVRGLERDHPALVDQYRVQGAPTRVLRSYSDG